MKKTMIPLLLLTLLFSGCGITKQTTPSQVASAPEHTMQESTAQRSPAQDSEHTYSQLTMAEAQTFMEAHSDFILVDVRTSEEYADGHIPGAINVPNETISDTEPTQLPDKEQTVLVYCRSGNRSRQAAEKLSKLGYTGILEIGGIQDWPGEITTDSSAE